VTLVQTRKVTSFPLVLIGSAYWGGLLQWLRETAAAEGTITLSDIDLLHVTDDVDEAVRIIVAGRSETAPKRPE
jgi:predicted Rossmann-fold nucleotide-binding protein